MGKASKALKEFIESIPDGKINGFMNREHTLYKDVNYRLDNQGLTTGEPKFNNLKVQVNRETTLGTLDRETAFSALQREAGKTVVTALVPLEGGWTPDMSRDELLRTSKI
ncbi:hypothetical protein ACHAPT_013456 [Fusarium lateritium]